MILSYTFINFIKIRVAARYKLVAHFLFYSLFHWTHRKSDMSLHIIRLCHFIILVLRDRLLIMKLTMLWCGESIYTVCCQLLPAIFVLHQKIDASRTIAASSEPSKAGTQRPRSCHGSTGRRCVYITGGNTQRREGVSGRSLSSSSSTARPRLPRRDGRRRRPHRDDHRPGTRAWSPARPSATPPLLRALLEGGGGGGERSGHARW
jgi:hypothetical protein